MSTTGEDRIVQIDTSEIELFVKEGSNLVFSPKAENNLLKLLKLSDLITEAIDQVKKNIATSALTVYPDFKGVIGDEVKAIYRSYGDVYKVVNPGKASAFVKETVMIRADTERIDEYLKRHGKLPPGIERNDREPKLSLSRI